MKTQFKLTRNNTLNSLVFFGTLIMASFALTQVNAQSNNANRTEISQDTRTVKGVINGENGPLESASVILKGTKTGTTTDSNGEFTFPIPLKTGDVLLISYLGYETQQAKIKEDTTFLRLTLTEELIEFVGALNSDKPYKSKRSN